METVTKGLLQIHQKLLRLKFVEVEEAKKMARRGQTGEFIVVSQFLEVLESFRGLRSFLLFSL